MRPWSTTIRWASRCTIASHGTNVGGRWNNWERELRDALTPVAVS